MRRIAAVIAALALVVSFAGTSFASGPITRVDTFVGNFDMLDSDGTVLGHVVVNFKPPDYGRVVPGELDITWAAGTTFPFPPSLQYAPATESHAQLIGGFFGPDAGGIVAGVSGYLCDYSAPWNAECRDFSAIFVSRTDGSRAVAWAFREPGDPNPYDYTYWYGVGKGAWALTYAGTTG